jgi:hypothetical protein
MEERELKEQNGYWKAIMIAVVIYTAVAIALFCTPCDAQDTFPAEVVSPAGRSEVVVIEASDGFHKAVIQAAVEAHREGRLSRAGLLRLRVAMLSPAFRRTAEDLACTQMFFYDGSIPLGEDGVVDRTAIDWATLLPFLIKLVPLLIEILKLIG